MTRLQPPKLPEHKPIEDMTAEERHEFARELGRITRRELAELNWSRRERKLRRGAATPRNKAEWEIFCTDFKTVEPDSGQPGGS